MSVNFTLLGPHSYTTVTGDTLLSSFRIDPDKLQTVACSVKLSTCVALVARVKRSNKNILKESEIENS